MPKEKNYNPAQEFHKKRKQEQIKKAKAEKQRLRDEKLARRDPNKIEAQIYELKMLEAKGQLSALDRTNLEILESDLKKVKRARKHMGPIIESEKTKAREAKEEKQLQKIPKHPKRSIYYDPVFNPYGVPPPGMPYKEWSDIEESEPSSDGPSTPESIAAIPMPSGSPPPSAYLNKKGKKLYSKRFKYSNKALSENINVSHLSHLDKQPKHKDFTKEEPSQSVSKPTIVYSADSILRDLKKESISFVPTSVQRKAVHFRRASAHLKKTELPNPIFKPKPTFQINAAPNVSFDE